MWRQNFWFCLFFVVACHLSSGFDNDFSKCKDTDLVVYNLIFETHWTRRHFPKQYPQNRPPAHWSSLIGMTHDKDYVLFRIGEMANEDFKIFAETGRTDILGKHRKPRHVYDEFSSSSIKTGAGKTRVNFFVDGNHSMVSLAVKIIPSPDWFVGVDSLALCTEGNWLDSITIEASPIDAGTDSGFTFTAPNWETEPQERISKITSKYPKHPANSFYYPRLRDLPAIATFHIVKKKFYQLTRRVEIQKGQGEIQSIRADNTTVPPQQPICFLQQENELNSTNEKGFKCKKFYKRRKFKKHNAKIMRKQDENLPYSKIPLVKNTSC